MKIEVWTDIMCPYCYIGKKHYESALRKFDHAAEVVLEWKAFQLNPDLPDKGQGYPLTEYFTRNLGFSKDKMEGSFAHVEQLAKEAGIPFNLRNAVAANTRDAHRLIKLAATKGLETKVVSLLSKAYFEDAQDYSDRNVLLHIGKEAGLEEEPISRMLNSDDYRYEIKQDIQEAANLGFDTVPTFLFDRRQAIIGSEPEELFVKVLNNAYRDWKARVEKEKEEIIITKGKACAADGSCEI
ncbi:DsbA family oxidoreductase [Limibacterium fermenti]|uniref:DsbA family oxidoreductase n=1 Tax=Limibacterium fermenti TaxID=3229863 RepID=UPI000E967229|nr:hypothetical protein [Porphyromonadaceae bacterium]